MKRRDFIKGLGSVPAVVAAKDLPEIEPPPCHEWELLTDIQVGVAVIRTMERREVTARVIQDTTEMVECEVCGEFYNKIVRKQCFEVTGEVGTYQNGKRILQSGDLFVAISGRNPEVRITSGDQYLEHPIKQLPDINDPNYEPYEILV